MSRLPKMSHVNRCTTFDPTKIYMLGEKDSGLEPRGPLQNYEELKSKHLQERTLFEDPQFRPYKISLGEDLNLNEVEWLRPKEITENPQFTIEGKDRFDINQGILGDCWFLSALADVTQKPMILEKVVPSNQRFDENYAGIFHFRFWQHGRWIDIVVDDRLPTQKIKGNDGRTTQELIFVRSTIANEFWTALLEKAYAKLYGSYESLQGGFTSEALGDLTGGLTEIHRVDQEPCNYDLLYDQILESYQKQSFMGCAISNCYKARNNGLIIFHAYSITEVIKIPSNQGNDIKLLRIRNPWGTGEWRGNWSDNSEKWDTVPSDIKAALSLRVREDGEFWMEFKDFMEHYDTFEICHPNPDVGQHHWNSCMLDGTWHTNKDNPQYSLTLEGEDMTSTHTVIIGLMQKNRRVYNKEDLLIGFKILTFEGELLYMKPPEYYVQVTGRVRLKKGKYVIVPFVQNLDDIRGCEYLLRVYSTIDFEL